MVESGKSKFQPVSGVHSPFHQSIEQCQKLVAPAACRQWYIHFGGLFRLHCIWLDRRIRRQIEYDCIGIGIESFSGGKSPLWFQRTQWILNAAWILHHVAWHCKSRTSVTWKLCLEPISEKSRVRPVRPASQCRPASQVVSNHDFVWTSRLIPLMTRMIGWLVLGQGLVL
jgi:hypothetical protein